MSRTYHQADDKRERGALTQMSKNPEKLSCVSIIICDDVYRDEATKKLIIIGTFNNIRANSTPCKHPRMVVLFTITNGHGEYDLSLSIEFERTGGLVTEFRGPLKLKDPLALYDINVTLTDMQFPEPGKYWVVLKADGEIIQQRPMFVVVPKSDEAAEHTNE